MRHAQQRTLNCLKRYGLMQGVNCRDSDEKEKNMANNAFYE